MKQTRLLMGMPITVEVADSKVSEKDFSDVFAYFHYVDQKFSPFKPSSEISRINRGKISQDKYTQDMKTVLRLSQETKDLTDGFFDILRHNKLDPSGLVKGWAIYNAADILKKRHFNNYYVEAGGDIQVSGKNGQGDKWIIGIRNPFDKSQIVKVLYLDSGGVATSGTYERGQHLYNPKMIRHSFTEILSLTVVGPNIFEADRYATAAFVMEERGIEFIERLPGFEGYMIDKNGLATSTSGFEYYTKL